MAEEQAVNGALAIIEIAQKIFQDKIMTDHGLQELTELESQVGFCGPSPQ